MIGRGGRPWRHGSALGGLHRAGTVSHYNALTVETFPIAPLLAAWRDRNPEHQQSRCTCTQGGCCASAESLARRVGVSHSTMHRRLRSGQITPDEADQWACIIGVPPHAVWRDDWGRSLYEPDLEAI